MHLVLRTNHHGLWISGRNTSVFGVFACEIYDVHENLILFIFIHIFWVIILFPILLSNFPETKKCFFSLLRPFFEYPLNILEERVCGVDGSFFRERRDQRNKDRSVFMILVFYNRCFPVFTCIDVWELILTLIMSYSKNKYNLSWTMVRFLQ
jgi:hypothetical protein